MKQFRKRTIKRFIETREGALLQVEYQEAVVVVFVDQIFPDGSAEVLIISGFLPDENENGSARLYEKDLSACFELKVLVNQQAEKLRKDIWLHQLIRQCHNII